MDSNVVVSLLISVKKGSPPAIVFSLIQRKQILSVTAVEILTEGEEVLNREKLVKLHNLTPKKIRAMIANWSKLNEIIPVTSRLSIVKADPDDDIVIACAVDGKVDYIVMTTGAVTNVDMSKYQPVQQVNRYTILKKK